MMRTFGVFLVLVLGLTGISFSGLRVNIHTWELTLNGKQLLKAHGFVDANQPVFIDTSGLSKDDTVKFNYYSDVFGRGQYITRLFLISPDGHKELASEVSCNYNRYAYFTIGQLKQICKDRKCDAVKLSYADKYVDPDEERSDLEFSELREMVTIELK